MEDIGEVLKTIEVVERIQKARAVAGSSSNELINVVNSMIQQIRDNTRVISELVEEIKNNQAVIDDYETRTQVSYEVDEDGFTNLAAKKQK